MAEGKCKKCGTELQLPYSEVETSRELVIVDRQTQEALVLYKGDKLCSVCGSSEAVDYYRRVR